MTFNATAENNIVTGDFNGGIKVWDLENSKAILSFKGHDQIINAMDGCGGQSFTSGPPELVTVSRDGFVKVSNNLLKDMGFQARSRTCCYPRPRRR
jgi:WD40 repeat protein